MSISYVFGDLKTGEIIEEIPLWSVSMIDVLNSDGELRGTFHLDMTGKQNKDLVDATIPGRCYVVAEISGVPIWGGIVWTRTYQATSKTFQLYCRGFEHYPSRRLIRQNISYSNTEQTSIFCSLWNTMQSITNGNFLVEVPSSLATGITRSVSYKASEYKTYGQVMSQLADGSFGFDWKIRIVRDGGVYRRILAIGYPTLGAPSSPNSIILEYPGAIVNYWETDSIGESGTNIDLLGAGEGDTMLISQWSYPNLLASGWIIFDATVPYKDVTDQNLLDDLGSREAINHLPPATVLKTEVKTDLDPIFGSYSLGDFMRIAINDPKHTKQIMGKRLIRWEFWPPESDEVGHAILAFESIEDE